MSECCRNNGDIVLCLANCVISRYVDKKLNEEPKKWVIIFVIRVWIGYAVDAGAVIFLWLKLGLPEWTDDYKVPILCYVGVVLLLLITLTVVAAKKWEAIANSYHPKIWRLIFVSFKMTTFVHALFVFYVADFREWYGSVTSVIAIIDMTLCVFEILRVLLCFCEFCPCAYHADPEASCLCFNCFKCREQERLKANQQYVHA